MATANSTRPSASVGLADAIHEAGDVLSALRAVEILACGDDVPTREQLRCLLTLFVEAFEARTVAMNEQVRGV